MRIIFAGTPSFSVPTLQSLIDSKHKVCCVLTQPDKPKGRGQKLIYTPVKSQAVANNIDVLQPTSLKDDAIHETLSAYQADVMVVIAYGLILPQKTLNLCHFGAINVHASILPKYRGAAPIQASILSGDNETGVTIMQMDEGLDTGDMLHIEKCDIDINETSQSLHDKLAAIGGPALLKTLEKIEQGSVKPISQDDNQATYAGKISKADGLIDWCKPVAEIDRQVRAYYGWPSCFSFINGKRFRIWRATIVDTTAKEKAGAIKHIDKDAIDVFCKQGVLRLEEIQFDGGKRLPVGAILNANQVGFTVGQQLGNACSAS